MKISCSFNSARICFDNLLLSDINNKYLSWVNDNQVIEFTSLSGKSTKLQLYNYIKKNIDSDDAVLLKMQIINNNNFHFGNFRISEINFINKSCDLALLIGEKNLWNKGLGVEAINRVIKYIKSKFSIQHYFSFIHINNLASIKIFKKNNFVEVDSNIIQTFKKNTDNNISKILYKYVN